LLDEQQSRTIHVTIDGIACQKGQWWPTSPFSGQGESTCAPSESVMRGRSMVRWMVLFGGVMLFAALGCSEDGALTQRQFAELVCERVEEEHSGVLTSRLDEGGFDYVRGNGDRGRLVVTEEYNYYTRHPESLELLVDRLVSLLGARDRLTQVDETNREGLHRFIMPVLKPPAFLAEAEARAGGQQMLYGEHASGLLVFYVLDEPTSMSFLTTASLSGLGLTLPQVNELALANLARRTNEDRYVVERREGGTTAVGDTRDGFDAARLLSPMLMMTLSRVLDSPAVILTVPRRDLMLAISASAVPAEIEALRERVRREHAAGPYSLSPELFLLDRQGFRHSPDSQLQ
jgi:hypothetical protein